MKKLLKEFIEAMERGYKQAPKTISDAFWEGPDASEPTACCPNGHASLGMFGDASLERTILFSWTQLVQEESDRIEWLELNTTIQLTYVIDRLASRGWTTPQVIAWLKTHLDD